MKSNWRRTIFAYGRLPSGWGSALLGVAVVGLVAAALLLFDGTVVEDGYKNAAAAFMALKK